MIMIEIVPINLKGMSQIMHNDLFSNIIPNLSLDCLYRLAPFSSYLQKQLKKDDYWRGRLERELGVIPKFPIDDWKRYYLELMAYPIGTRGYLIDPLQPKAQPIRVPYRRDRRAVYQLLWLNEKTSKPDCWQLVRGGIINHKQFYPTPERIKKMISFCNELRLIAWSGKMYRFQKGRFEELPLDLPVTDLIANSYDIYLLLSRGIVYSYVYPNQIVKKISINNDQTKILQIADNSGIDEFGAYYSDLLGRPRQFIKELDGCYGLFVTNTVLRQHQIVEETLVVSNKFIITSKVRPYEDYLKDLHRDVQPLFDNHIIKLNLHYRCVCIRVLNN